jgi:hypothetical protein
MYGNRNPPGVPPCDTCRVELLAANREAASIYMTCRRQYVTAEEGRVVGISIAALKAAMDIYGVQDQKECLDKVTRAFFHFENRRNRG